MPQWVKTFPVPSLVTEFHLCNTREGGRREVTPQRCLVTRFGPALDMHTPDRNTIIYQI